MAGKKGKKGQKDGAKGESRKEGSKKAKAETAEPSSGSQPFDFAGWAQQLTVPGVDMSTVVEAGREDFEALQHANEAAIEGWQKLAQRQTEMLQESLTQWQTNLTDSAAHTPQENMEQQAALAQQGLTKTLESMRELTEIATDSQAKAFEILSKRYQQNMDKITNRGSSDK